MRFLCFLPRRAFFGLLREQSIQPRFDMRMFKNAWVVPTDLLALRAVPPFKEIAKVTETRYLGVHDSFPDTIRNKGAAVVLVKCFFVFIGRGREAVF